ncbi:MAG: RNA-binding protein [Hyphomicrobiaceae bacterium]
MGGRQKKPAKFDEEPVVGPIRRCAVTRTRRERDDLIRFVADPVGGVVPDLGLKLPGRGVWVTADRTSVQEASKRRSFAAGLKQPVEVPSDLADKLEALLVNRATSALAMANKAGQVLSGFDKVTTVLETGRVKGLIHGAGAAEGGREKLDRKYMAIARDGGEKAIGRARVVDCLTVEQLSLAMGRSNVVHAALITGGAAKRFLAEAERLARYRSGIEHSSSLSNRESDEKSECKVL